jgi:hypothetical protein
MTEDEAKTKWCPMTTPFVTAPQIVSQEGGFNCIGSDCMMWRATDNECRPQAQLPSDASVPKSFPAGYCGLAGKP